MDPVSRAHSLPVMGTGRGGFTHQSFNGYPIESNQFPTDPERLRGSVLASPARKLSGRDAEDLGGLSGREQRRQKLC
jgi:hypothetical protein